MDYLLSVALFAISSSVTPGPNNIMVMSSGVNFGIKRSLPLLTGICTGFTLMLFLVGMGFGEVFKAIPELELIVKVTGIVYLIYLAYLVSQSGEPDRADGEAKPMSFVKGAMFQWVNAKAWVIAIGAVSAFTTAGESFFTQNLTIATTFFLVSFPAVGVWLLFGSVLRNALKTKTYRLAFNYCMAALLLISVLPVAMDIADQVSLI
ncbi:LysE family translocator [Vibrio sonorensis]|uniref:LysE family translocator n=1 Tax=Vibrio sonorensis TaxID=1004316 RepID=UPI0008DB2FCB|nr:LysE family translocator [Vibrio sonorensis]